MAGAARTGYPRGQPMELPLIIPSSGLITATAAAETPSFPHPTAPAPSRARYSSHLLEELLALNEDMIEQLHLERQSETGTADFLNRMIQQHEKAAALLKSQLAEPGDVT